MESRNPATGQLIERFDTHGEAYVDEALRRAEKAANDMRLCPVRDRAEALRSLASRLEGQRDQLAQLATEEMGKTLNAARAEIEKCAAVCRYYAEHGSTFLADQPLKINKGSAHVAHLPMGPILAVMPWNFPFWQVFRFAAPALMAGNPGLLKHASNVPRCALAIEALIDEAPFPSHSFQTLLIGADRIEPVLRDPRVRGVTLTGSEPAGAAVAALAGDAIKPSLLELGGSDAFIVMPSADLDKAAEAAVKSRTLNNGQSCIAAKRFIAHNDIYEPFRDRVLQRLKALKLGDPTSDDTDIGPLSSAQALEDAVELIERSVGAGAARVYGAEGVCLDGFEGGHWFRPGLVEDIPKSAPLYSEEIFAPVALMFGVPDLDAAIDLANDSRFGLGSTIFTGERAEARRAVQLLEAGATAINRIVASDPRLPFGGVKSSGYGRELGRDGLMAFVNRKTVTVQDL